MQKQTNSTIFKTLNGDLTVFNKTLISTKDNLKALETVNATVYNKNGAFNLQGLLVNSSQSVSTFTKLNNAFKAYNGNLSKSTQLQNAYVQAVGKQNISLGNYLAGLNGAKASMGGYIKSLIGAKAATIGLQVASVVLNTTISMGITMAISALVSAITKWVNKEKEAREEAIENAKAAKEEANNLSELLNKYNQLSKEVKSNQGVKEDLLSVQSDLLETLGIEASQIDTLIEKYGNLDSAINQITLDSLRDAQGDLMAAVDAYEKELINVGKGYAHWYSLTDRNILSAGSDSVKLFDILEKAGIISSGSHGEGGGALILTGDDKTVEGILENYQKLKEAQEALNTAIDNGEVTMEEMISNSLYKSINARLNELKKVVDNYYMGIDDINEAMAQQQILKSLAEQYSIPETKEEFEVFQQSMIDTAIASTKFKGSQDDIRDSIINVLSVMPEFEKYFEELNEVQGSTSNGTAISTSDIFSLKDAEDNATALSKLSDQLSSVESAYNTCLTAKEEYDEQGYLSVDTLQDVLALGDEYLQYLFDEEGNVRLDADAFQQLAQARINDMETQALSNLADNIKQITDEATATEYLAQKQNDLASSYADVAANALLALRTVDGFSDSESLQGAYNSFKTQYEQIKSLFANTRKGLSSTYTGKSSSTSSKSSSDPLKDAFTQEYNTLKHNLEMEYITEKQYYDSLAALNRKYFSGKEEYLDEYRQYEEEVYKGLKSFYKDCIESQMDLLESRLDAGVISYQFYSSTVKALLDDMYADSKISAEDYHTYIKEMLNKQKDIYDKVLSAVTGRFDTEIDRINDTIEAVEKQNDSLEKQKDKYDSILSAVQDLIDTKKASYEAHIEAIEAENDAIQEQLGNYDALLGAVSDVFDEKRDSVQSEIDLLQERIDRLQEANDEESKAVALEKAKYELERAMNQRTKMVYKDGQFVYAQDGDAISAAGEALKDLEFDAAADALEKEKELLGDIITQLDKAEEAWSKVSDAFDENKRKSIAESILGENYRDIILQSDPEVIGGIMQAYMDGQQKLEDSQSLVTSINEKIDCLDRLADKWNSIADEREKTANKELAAEQLGAEWEALILDNRIDVFEAFKISYLAIQAQLDDNASLIESCEEKAAYYESLKSQWSEIADVYEQSVEDQYAAMILGQEWEADVLSGRLDTLAGFKKEYISIQQEMADAAIAADNAIVEANLNAQNSLTTLDMPVVSAGNQDNGGKDNDDNDKTTGIPVKKKPVSGGGSSALKYDRLYASGTAHAQRGLNLVGEEGTETYIDNDGNAALVTKPALIPMEGGEIVKNAEDTKTLLRSLQSLQRMMPYYSSLTMPDIQMPRYDTLPMNKDNSVTVNMGDIHLHEVQNADTFANEIIREASVRVTQKLGKR